MSILPASGIGDESTGFYNKVATQSLRTTHGDSNYFYYTPSAGDRLTGSFSMWLKGEQLSNTAYGRYVFQNYGGGSEAQFSFIQINNTGNMAFGGYGVNYFASTAFLRDETNWYNLLWTWDTANGTQNKRQRGYVNGVELTDMGSGTRSGIRQELGYGGNFQHNFLANYYPPGGGSDSYVAGHTAYTCYVNGLALDPTAFGEDKNGVWIPKNYETKPSQIAQGTGTAIGDLTTQGGLAGAFNGTRFQAYGSGAATDGSQATGYIGKNWGSSKTITGFILYSPTNFGFVGSGASTFTVKLYGKNGAPSSATDGTLLFTSSSVNDNLVSTNGERGAIKYFADTTITSEETISSFTTTTAFTYHWVVITPNTSESVHMGQIEFYEDGNTRFGTGGFRLDFNESDLNVSGSSRTDPYGSGTDQPNNTIADASGSGNHLTKTTNIIASDFVIDSPENNFCVLNGGGKQTASVITEGNLKAVITSGTNSGRTPATFAVNSGKWYWEVRQSSSNRFAMGVFDTEKYVMANEDGGVDQYEWVLVTDDNSGAAQLVNNSNYTSGYGGTVADGHVVMVALDVDNGAIWFGKQDGWFNKGTSDDSATVKAQIEAGTTTNAAFTGVTGRLTPCFVRQTSNNTLNVNFGSDSTFANTESSATNTDSKGKGEFQYEPPSGFLALCSSNLPELALSPAQSEQANNHFDVAEHTSTGGTSDSAGAAPTVNVTSLNFQPDWVIIKGRSYTDWGETFDSNRGVNKNLQAFRNYSETDYGNTLTAFNSNGFTLGADSTAQVNWRQNNYVSWNWHCNSGSTSTNDAGSIDGTQQVNTTAGYSITSYTANNNTKCTIGHGLSQAPNMVFIKNRSSSSNGQWTIGQDMYTGFTGQMYIDSGSNGTGGFSSNSGSFDNTAPTSTLVTINTDNTVNEGTDSFIMYCFHSVEGYSKFGSYVGNNSTDGTFVYTGFRPAFVMVKYASGSGEDWIVWDKLRDPDNLVHNKLYWNTNNQEITDTTNRMMDFLSTGFKHRTDHVSTNGNGGTYIYMAFAEQPFKFSNAR